MARLALGAVGAVVGFYVGGPFGALEGFSLGYSAGGLFDPNEEVLGPRLQDLKAPAASYGAPITYVEGAPRLAGNYIWASQKREVETTTSEGKGGPGVDSTTFTYEMDVLIELAINRCQAIRRVWSNGKLVWSNADDSDGETLIASSLTTAWREIRFYDGAPDQLPDPTYEAAVGVGNAPAYRTRTTVMIEGLNLGNSGQLPILTFEVVSEATQDYSVSRFASFVHDPLLDTVPFTSGITAMNPAGFDFLYGIGYSGSQFRLVNVYSVASDGTITLTGQFDLGTTPYHGVCLVGSTDVSCIVASQKPTGFFIERFTVLDADGTRVVLDMGNGPLLNLDQQIFARHGDYMVLAGQSVLSDKKIRIFNAETGALLFTSPAMASYMQWAAIGDGVVYALESNALLTGDEIYVVSLADGSLVGTIATPITAQQSALATDDDGNLYFFALGVLGDPYPVYMWDGSTWERIVEDEELLYGTPNERHAYYANNGILAVQKYEFAGLVIPEERFYIAIKRTTIVEPTLDQVVRRLCLRTGLLTDADIDVTDLSHDVAIADGLVRAMAVSQVSETRATLETLMAAYFFECAEGETLRFVRRGGPSVASIPYDDLAASPDGSIEPLPLKRLNDPEIAARVSVRYANTLNDFQDGLEAADRLVTESKAEAVIDIPLGFQPSEAKKLADANTMDLAVKLLEIGPIALPRKWSALEPSDVVTLTDALGDTFRARITKGTIGGGVLQFDLVLDDAFVIDSLAVTDEDYASSSLIRLLSSSELEVLDLPPLRDEDALNLGPYVAVSAGPKWSAAQVDKSDDGTTFAKVATVTTRSIVGHVTTELPDFPGWDFDDISVLRVDVGDNTLESSTTENALLGNAPAYLIGSEIVYACRATFVSAGVYDLSIFLRGLRGTEWAKTEHEIGDLVVVLDKDALRVVTDDASDLNVERYYRATTLGKLAEEDGEGFTDTGIRMKPFAPVDLAVDRSDPASLVVRWNRRSRLNSSLFGGQPPLGEIVEAYDVELYDPSDVLVSSTIVTDPEWTASGLAETGAVDLPPVAMLHDISGTRVAVRTDFPGSWNAFTSERLLAFDSANTQTEIGPILGVVSQLCVTGSLIYAVTYRLTNTVPSVYSESKVWKFTLGSLATADASATAGSPGDWVGIAFDGTNPWISEQTSGNLRKLNPTTLASVASYAIAGGPTALAYASGKLWVLLQASSEVARWDIATHTEDFRFSFYADIGLAGDLMVSGSHVFVFGSTGIGIYTTAAGVLVRVEAAVGVYLLPGRTGALFGSQIAVAVTSPTRGVVFLDAGTGDREDIVSSPDTYLAWVAGAIGADLYLTVSHGAGFSWDTRAYEPATPGFVGYSVKVYQAGTFDRGYPATLEL